MQGKEYFKNLSDAALAYAIKDIRATLALADYWPDNGAASGKYSDQLYAAVSVQKERDKEDPKVCFNCGHHIP
jgi:hypothetical protein